MDKGTFAMNRSEGAEHLSGITTCWALVDAAHRGPEDAARSARSELMQRYGGAAYRYLLGALSDPDAAEELAQEFALRFVRGDFHRADPGRGRFRGYIKTALFHMIVDHRRKQRRRPLPLTQDTTDEGESDQRFEQNWRDEILSRTWLALAASQRPGDRDYYVVLRFRAEHPELPSHELAEWLESRLGRKLTAVGVRQTLHRARGRFAKLLVKEVAHTLKEPTQESLELELIDLGLIRYCRPALQHRVVD